MDNIFMRRLLGTTPLYSLFQFLPTRFLTLICSFLNILIYLHLNQVGVVETTPLFSFLSWRRNPPKKVLLKFYLHYLNLAVYLYSEDEMTMTSALVAILSHKGLVYASGVGLSLFYSE